MTCEYVEKFSIKPPQPPAKNKGTPKKNSTHKKKIPNEVFKATLPRNFDASQKKRKQPSIEDLGTPPPMSTEPSPRRKKSGTPKFEASKWQEAQNGPKPFTAEIDSDVELEDQVRIALRTVIQMKKAKELHTMQQAIELAKKHAEEETARRGSAPMSDEELVAKLARKQELVRERLEIERFTKENEARWAKEREEKEKAERQEKSKKANIARRKKERGEAEGRGEVPQRRDQGISINEPTVASACPPPSPVRTEEAAETVVETEETTVAATEELDMQETVAENIPQPSQTARRNKQAHFLHLFPTKLRNLSIKRRRPF